MYEKARLAVLSCLPRCRALDRPKPHCSKPGPQTKTRPGPPVGGPVNTFTQFQDRVSHLAYGLRSLGTHERNCVGSLPLNSDRYVEYFIAVLAVRAAVNARLKAPHFAEGFNNTLGLVEIVEPAGVPPKAVTALADDIAGLSGQAIVRLNVAPDTVCVTACVGIAE